jgi:hypothetical protein
MAGSRWIEEFNNDEIMTMCNKMTLAMVHDPNNQNNKNPSKAIETGTRLRSEWKKKWKEKRKKTPAGCE